jgi:F-type H+-transporting ATPase subunit b
MNTLLLLAEADGGGQIEQIARTFGVDWPHLIAQMISFSIVCFLLYRFAYRPVLRMLGERRQLIADGQANAEKIKAELARTEAQRQAALTQANLQASQFIENARAAAAKLQQQESQKAIATAEQIMARAREAADQDHARRTQTGSGPVGCADHCCDHPQGSDRGRSAASVRGNGEAVERVMN